MKKVTLCEAVEFLKEHDNYVILTHIYPDGDAIGSAAALCRGLRQLGKAAFVFDNPQIKDKMRPFAENLLTTEICSENTVISVDTSAPSRIVLGFDAEKFPVRLAIDHHEGHTMFADLAYIEPQTAACGEIVLKILEQLGVQLDEKIGEALYLAISTDTGCFRFSDTNESTLMSAAKCYASGADIFAINEQFHSVKTLGRMRLEGFLIQNSQFFYDNSVCVQRLGLADIERLGVTEDDLDNVASFARQIEGVRLGILLREVSESCTKVSLRSVPDISSTDICGTLGGGGHRAAAGVMLNVDMDTAYSAIMNAVEQYLVEQAKA